MTASHVTHPPTALSAGRRSSPRSLSRLASAASRRISALAVTVSGIVDGAQLGSAPEVDLSRHSGGRI